jgi:hypothetical protein
MAASYSDIGMRQVGGTGRVLSDDDRDPCQRCDPRPVSRRPLAGRCCVPSWRSRSIRRRVSSDAATIRLREALSAIERPFRSRWAALYEPAGARLSRGPAPGGVGQAAVPSNVVVFCPTAPPSSSATPSLGRRRPCESPLPALSRAVALPRIISPSSASHTNATPTSTADRGRGRREPFASALD